MGNSAKKRVGLIGFKPVQRQVIQSIFALSEARDISYAAVDDADAFGADLLLVDGDDYSAVEQWESHERSASDESTLLIGDEPVEAATHQIKRSQLAGQLLNILDDLSARSALAKAAEVAGVIGRPHVIVIDDSLSVRTQMSICLQDFNIDVSSVETAEEAMQIVSSRKVDLVFLDVMLPGMDGYEACGQLKRLSNSALPVVLLTSKSSPFNKVRGVLAGCDRYVTKPADVKDVASIISHFLGEVVVTPDSEAQAVSA